MQYQQSQQINLIDNFHHSTTSKNYDFNANWYHKQDNSSQIDNKWIQDFLAPSALIDYSPLNIKSSEDQNEAQMIETLPESKENCPDSIEMPKRQRSVFHNFQKHLITLLKKIVYIRRVDVLNKLSGARALELWNIFKEGRNFSKKVFTQYSEQLKVLMILQSSNFLRVYQNCRKCLQNTVFRKFRMPKLFQEESQSRKFLNFVRILFNNSARWLSSSNSTLIFCTSQSSYKEMDYASDQRSNRKQKSLSFRPS